MNRFQEENGALIWSKNHETLMIQPWGKDSLRVRSTILPEIIDTLWALLTPVKVKAKIEINDNGAQLRNGKAANWRQLRWNRLMHYRLL